MLSTQIFEWHRTTKWVLLRFVVLSVLAHGHRSAYLAHVHPIQSVCSLVQSKITILNLSNCDATEKMALNKTKVRLHLTRPSLPQNVHVCGVSWCVRVGKTCTASLHPTSCLFSVSYPFHTHSPTTHLTCIITHHYLLQHKTHNPCHTPTTTKSSLESSASEIQKTPSLLGRRPYLSSNPSGSLSF